MGEVVTPTVIGIVTGAVNVEPVAGLVMLTTGATSPVGLVEVLVGVRVGVTVGVTGRVVVTGGVAVTGPLQATLLSVNPVGFGLVVVQPPLKPMTTEPPGLIWLFHDK